MKVFNANSEKIKKELQKYGLNPQHWKIYQSPSQRCILIHRRQPWFQLLGLYSQRFGLYRLEVISTF